MKVTKKPNLSVINVKDNDDTRKLEIAYLKEILKQKDIIISNLMDYIQTLKEHLIPTKNESENKNENSDKNLNDIPKQRRRVNNNSTNPVPNQNTASATKPASSQAIQSQPSPSISSNYISGKISQQNPDENRAPKVRNVINRDVWLAVLEAETMNKMSGYINLANINSRAEEEWKEVKKGKPRRKPIVGSDSNTETVKGVPKFVALHVSGLDISTSTESLKSLLQDKFKEVTVEEITSRHPNYYKPFKVYIMETNFKQAMDPTIWPFGTNRFLEYKKKTAKERT